MYCITCSVVFDFPLEIVILSFPVLDGIVVMDCGVIVIDFWIPVVGIIRIKF
jgi:hypothetical protein